MKELTYNEAVLEAFREEMRRDDKVFHLCGNPGPLASLVPEFGAARVRGCPISEEAYVGAGIGAAGSGFRPIIIPGMMTFAFTAMDQIVTRWQKFTTCSADRRPSLWFSAPPPAGDGPLRPNIPKVPPNVHEPGGFEAGHAFKRL